MGVAEQAARVVGGYALQRRLGAGAVGEVWLGWHQTSDMPAAVKLLRDSGPRESQQLLEREWKAAARLSHPNIVSVYDAGQGYLAMAYIEGTTLAHRLKSPITPFSAVQIARDIASALAHAHGRGVVHRDVKPANVLLDLQSRPYLGDFGLALLAEETRRATMRAGTPGYMAPEQRIGKGVGPAADQYALARTLVEMFAGASLPPDDEKALELLPANIAAALGAVLRRALAETPSERWPDIDGFVEALSHVDLSSEPPPLRLAPELRVRAPFGWCATPVRQSNISPEVARAEYRLRHLADADVLSQRAIEAFTARSGLRDVGWDVFANTGRLGPIDQSSLLARASDIVVLMHGTLCDRRMWSHAAQTLCRSNAQTVVLVPDVLGSGETSFASDDPRPEHASPRGLLLGMLAWLRLLNVRDLPTVLVGYSLAGMALLAMRDDELGERTSRVALTPVFPGQQSVFRRELLVAAWLMRRTKRLPKLRAWLGRMALMHGKKVEAYAQHEREALYDQFVRLPPGVLARIMEEVARAKPEPADRLERCLAVVGTDDPVAPAEHTLAVLDGLGFPRRSLRTMDTHGHMPVAEIDDHPGWAMRNGEQLARIVESLMVSSREGAPLSTAIETTLLASTDPAL
ncbi:MAG TPA: alpha/beta fold hydrolase, partial [Polyangiaceae bacterium]|nr:alpha/beta fold hydrolase [Polyangiaceae bacterium]